MASSMSCAVGNSSDKYVATTFRNSDPDRIAEITASVDDPARKFGIEGYFWSFILLMTMITIGYWNPPVGVMLYGFGIILLGGMGIIDVSIGLIIAEVAIGVAFIWAFRS